MNFKLKLGLLIGGALAATAAFAQGLALVTTLASTDVIPLATGTLSSGITAPNLANYVKSTATAGGNAPITGQSFFADNTYAGAYTPLAITDGTEVTCVATTTYISQISIPANTTITGVALVNATAVAGAVTVQLADSTGAPIAAAVSASISASGTAAFQRVPFAVAYAAKGPATYFLMLQCNNTGYKFRALTVGNSRTQSVTSGTYGTFASFTPATTFTTAVGAMAGLY